MLKVVYEHFAKQMFKLCIIFMLNYLHFDKAVSMRQFPCLSVQCNENMFNRYHNEIILEDSTVAYHLGRTIQYRTSKPFCGLMYNVAHTTIVIAQCDQRKASAYVCEFDQSAAQPVETSLLSSLHSPWESFWNRSSTNTFRTVTCQKGHVTHTLLACDQSSDCWLDTSGGHSARDGVKCSAPLRPLPPSFGCGERGQYVPYTLVCDHRPDCFDGTDEHFCVFTRGNHTYGPFICAENSAFRCGRTMEVVNISNNHNSKNILYGSS